MDVFSPLPRPQVVVSRHTFTGKSSIGDMIIRPLGLSRFCYTLEDTCRHGADGVLQAHEKVQDQTAIPTGIYELELDVSGRFGFCPFIQSVPLFLDARIHWGNTATDTRGCVLVGRTKGVDVIGESKLAFKALMLELVPIRRLEKIYLEIC